MDADNKEGQLPPSPESTPQSESREEFFARMAAAANSWESATRQLTELQKKYNIKSGQLDLARSNDYFSDPATERLLAERTKLGVILSAGAERLISQTDHRALHETIRDISAPKIEGPASTSILDLRIEANTLNNTLLFIDPEIIRPALSKAITSSGHFETAGGKLRLSDDTLNIISRLAISNQNFTPAPPAP